MSYAEIHDALRAKLRWEQARLLQADQFPDPDRAHQWALWLEVLRRLETAHAARDRPALRAIMRVARMIVS
jgi:hypothetical protein